MVFLLLIKIFLHSMFVAESDSRQTDFVCESHSSQTLAEILNEVTQQNESVLSTMIDETGHFRPNVAVFFGSDQQLRLEGPDVVVGENVKEISIFPALSGG